MPKPGIVIIVALFTLLAVVSIIEFTLTKLSSTENLADSQQRKDVSQLYVFGGVDKNSSPISSASRLSSTSGKWETIRGMPTPKTDFCGAVVDDKIYLFGGWRDRGHDYRPIIYSDTVVYNSSAGSYKSLRPMQGPRKNCGAAVLNGSIYVAGGTNPHIFGVESTVLRYNIKTDQWSTVRRMNFPRRNCRLMELNGRLYVFGYTYTVGNENTVEVYDLVINRWALLGNTLSIFNSSFSVAVHESKIYVLDGKHFEVYSSDMDQWSILKTPEDVTLQTLASMNGKLWSLYESSGDVKKHWRNRRDVVYYPGRGTSWRERNPDLTKQKSVYSYDPLTKEWQKAKPEMNVFRCHPSVFVVNH